MSLRAEMLLAETGVLSSRAVTFEEAQAAEAGLVAMHRRITSWVRSQDEKGAKFEPCRERDPERTFQRLATAPGDAEKTEMLGQFTDYGLAAEWWTAREAAREYLVSARPSFQLETATGPEELPLSPDDAEEWLSLVDIVEDPARVLDELDMFSLTPTQADTFRACYPELFKLLSAFLSDALVDMSAKKKRVTWERDSVMRVFLGLPPEAKVIAQGTSQAIKQSPPPPPKVDLISALKTPSQRLLSRA